MMNRKLLLLLLLNFMSITQFLLIPKCVGMGKNGEGNDEVVEQLGLGIEKTNLEDARSSKWGAGTQSNSGQYHYGPHQKQNFDTFGQENHHEIPTIPNSGPSNWRPQFGGSSIPNPGPSAAGRSTSTLTNPNPNQHKSLTQSQTYPISNSSKKHIEPNAYGTMEIFYTEIGGGKNGEKLQIYRQRDNSGAYVKFRHVGKLSRRAEFSCVAPLPRPTPHKLELYFNNNPRVPSYFDRNGLEISREQYEKDESPENELYDRAKFQKWIGGVIGALVRDSSYLIVLPFATQPPASIKYPFTSVYEWAGLQLPIHRDQLKPGKELDVIGVDPEAGERFATLTERMDDGQNWVRIQVREQGSRAIHARNLHDPHALPLERGKLVLFFDGVREAFDAHGMSMSVSAYEFWLDEEQKRQRIQDEQRKKEEAEKSKMEWRQQLGMLGSIFGGRFRNSEVGGGRATNSKPPRGNGRNVQGQNNQ